MTKPPKPQIVDFVLSRDKYTCQDCGKVGRGGSGKDKLQVHHIVPRFMDGSNEPDNLVALCGACHIERDKQFRQHIVARKVNLVTVKLGSESRRNLKLLAALLGESMPDVMDAAVSKALEQAQHERAGYGRVPYRREDVDDVLAGKYADVEQEQQEQQDLELANDAAEARAPTYNGGCW